MTMLKNNYTILECEENWPLPDGRALHLTWPYLALPLDGRHDQAASIEYDADWTPPERIGSIL